MAELGEGLVADDVYQIGDDGAVDVLFLIEDLVCFFEDLHQHLGDIFVDASRRKFLTYSRNANFIEFVDGDKGVGMQVKGYTGRFENVGEHLAVIDPDGEIIKSEAF